MATTCTWKRSSFASGWIQPSRRRNSRRGTRKDSTCRAVDPSTLKELWKKRMSDPNADHSPSGGLQNVSSLSSYANTGSSVAYSAGDFSSRDVGGKCVFYVCLWKRNGISLRLFDEYWQNLHGAVCARLPGQHQYWQYHVAHYEGGIFPEQAGLQFGALTEDYFDGIAELTFRTEQDRTTWFTAAAVLMDDEHNIFSKAIGYNSKPGNSVTFLDRMPVGDPNGETDIIKFHCLIKKAHSCSVEQFQAFVRNSMVPSFMRSKDLLKLRMHVFEEVDLSRPPAAGVDHAEPREKSYEGALEIAFSDRLAMEQFFASPAYKSAMESAPQYIRQIVPFPERSAYTFVYDSKMTLAGERGAYGATLIKEIGAVNQLQPELHSLITRGYTGSLGPTTH